MEDIRDKEDIKIFIDAFYKKVRKDDLLGPVFNFRIEEGEWGTHLERMYDFGNTVLFAARDYRGNPFSKHTTLSIEAAHFKQWMALMNATVDERFMGPKTEEVKMRVAKMGAMFQLKLKHIRSNENYRNIM